MVDTVVAVTETVELGMTHLHAEVVCAALLATRQAGLFGAA